MQRLEVSGDTPKHSTLVINAFASVLTPPLDVLNIIDCCSIREFIHHDPKSISVVG